MYLIRCAVVFLTIVFGVNGSFVTNNAYSYEHKKNVEISDPLESVNRAVYGFNMFLDKILIEPITKAYQVVVPEMGRKGIRNVLTNLSEPVTFVNAILQRDAEHSFTTFWRFTINSTFGIGGLFDVAKLGGLENRKEDFGQTMGVYGIGNGPYLMLPILGPSNTRDLFGSAVDSFTDPYNYAVDEYGIAGRNLVKGLDTRESLMGLWDELQRTSLDPYAAIRSLYTQKRADEIANGEQR